MGSLRRASSWLGLAEDEDDARYEEAYTDEREASVYRLADHGAGAFERRDDQAGAQDHRIATVCPTGFRDARTIGEYFRDGVPVIINLSSMTEQDAKRVVDFASGLIFGLHGSIERVASRVFLLSPADVTLLVGDASTNPRGGGGLFDQR